MGMLSDEDKRFGEILMAGYLMGSLILAQFTDDYDVACVGYPEPGATNALEIRKKTGGPLYRITVEIVDEP